MSGPVWDKGWPQRMDRCTGPAPAWWVGDLDQGMQGHASRKRTPRIFRLGLGVTPHRGVAPGWPHASLRVWPEARRCPFLVVQVCQLVKGHPGFASRSQVGWQQIQAWSLVSILSSRGGNRVPQSGQEQCLGSGFLALICVTLDQRFTSLRFGLSVYHKRYRELVPKVPGGLWLSPLLPPEFLESQF